MTRRSILQIAPSLVSLALLGAACDQRGAEVASMNKLVFLTRSGCPNSTMMRANLDDALRALGLPDDYQFIDIASLPASDARVGYPTPTVLLAGRDLFGMSEPVPPFPDPT